MAALRYEISLRVFKNFVSPRGHETSSFYVINSSNVFLTFSFPEKSYSGL